MPIMRFFSNALPPDIQCCFDFCQAEEVNISCEFVISDDLKEHIHSSLSLIRLGFIYCNDVTHSGMWNPFGATFNMPNHSEPLHDAAAILGRRGGNLSAVQIFDNFYS